MRGIVVALMFLVMVSSVSAILVEHWGIYEDDLYSEFVTNDVNLDIRDLPSRDKIKVVFTIPELDVRESKGPYDPEDLQHTQFTRTLWLPSDADYGEYVLRMTITDSEGNKHIKHRFIEID
jgi:hypothetical protein